MVRERRFILFLAACFFSVIFLSECKKPESSSLLISGIVSNEQTNEVLSDVQVSLKTRSLQSGTFNNNFQTIGSDQTDNSGIYEFEFQNSSIASIQLTFEKEGYFLKEIEVSPDDIDLVNGFELNVFLNSVAEINLNLVNQTPVNDDDKIEFKYTNASFVCSCCNNEERILAGTSIDTTLTCFTPGNITLKYLSFVTKAGMTTLDTGSFVISPGVNNLEVLY